MKRILVLLVAVLPLFLFSSCSKDDVEDLTSELAGSMNLTVNGTAHDFSTAVFYTKDGYTYIATAGDITFKNTAPKGIGANTVIIKIKGTPAVGNYVLGLGEDITGAIANIGQVASILNNNALMYYPSASEDEAFVSVYGLLKITSVSSTKIQGTLSGAGVTRSAISNLSSLLTSGGLKVFSGSFKAKGYSLK